MFLRIRPVDKIVEDAWSTPINGMTLSSASFHSPFNALAGKRWQVHQEAFMGDVPFPFYTNLENHYTVRAEVVCGGYM
jgi:hypothetical protein